MATFTLTPRGYRAALPSGLPDLIVQSVSASVGSPVVGDHVVFSAVVKNQGTAPTPTGVGIGILFSVDGNPANWTTDTSGPLAAGATRTLTATNGTSGGNYWAATLGGHTVSANVNDTLTISESNTANNTLASTISVGSSGGGGGSPSSTWGPLGNTGTRWVSNTPTWNQVVPNSVEVDCTWAAIQAGIQSFTSAQVAAGARVMVRPGTLPGNGYGSTATPVIQNVGSTSWTQRVLVRPRDGYGTVTVGNIRVYRVHNVTWAGFTGGGWRIDSCVNAGQAWIKMTGSAWWSTSSGGPAMTGLHVVEVVRPNSFMADSDSSDCWPNGANIESPLFEGCFIAPAWRAAGSSFHSDTLQFEPLSGTVNNLTMRDCVAFGSKNSVIQINAVNTGLFDHCYFVARPYCLTRWPIPAGGDPTVSQSWALNGGGKGGATPNLTVNNCAVIGAWTIEDFGNPSGVVMAGGSGNIVRSGSLPPGGTYTAYSGLTDDNFNSLTGLTRPGIPDADYSLSTIWS